MSSRSAAGPHGAVLLLTGALLALGLSALPLRSTAQQTNPFEDSPFLRMDPEKVLIERDWRIPCGECHPQTRSTLAVWPQLLDQAPLDEQIGVSQSPYFRDYVRQASLDLLSLFYKIY